MFQVAVLVDAGYFFAKGSEVLTGSTKARRDARLDRDALVAELRSFVRGRAGNRRLLRIYWYDGLPHRAKRPTARQRVLAESDDIKLRLGLINKGGEQKGVDSLIVTDLAELARNGAISDAVLLSGDEDVRVGVQIAQGFGVRIHLLGFASAERSQAETLRFEADTTTEWGKDLVAKFLQFSQDAVPHDVAHTEVAVQTRSRAEDEVTLCQVANDVVERLNAEQITHCTESWSRSNRIPKGFDRNLITSCRDRLDRDLSREEQRIARREFIRRLKQPRNG